MKNEDVKKQDFDPVRKYNCTWRNNIILFFTIKNTPKKGNFQFCISGLLGIHRNPNLKEFLKFRESFWHFWPLAWNSRIFFAKRLLLRHYESAIYNKIFLTFSRVCQIQDLGQSKYKLRLFSKRTQGISKILFNLGSCEFLARLESKNRKCLFFDGLLL